jgi:threonine dehydrogenase-like Zn-dependent dehydrogenase
MRAITVEPGRPQSARLEDVAEPSLSDGEVLVQSLALGICGTDREILSGMYGSAPSGEHRLILGHESLGRVLEAPSGSGLKPDDLVVGIVRRPDPVPCSACAAGEWDMCLNGRYSERGIKDRHGYGAERFRIEPGFAVKIDATLGLLGVLLEPASILAKAWDHTERVGQRLGDWQPRTLLVTGAGPIGLLAALMGAQRGLDVRVLDHPFERAKSELVKDLGGTYCANIDELDDGQPDILMECSGAPPLVAEVLARTAPAGILCLVGVTAPGHDFKLDIGRVCRTLVLDNHTIFGTVNANRRHYELGAQVLARADRAWLRRLITRQIPIMQWEEAMRHCADDIKVVIEFDTCTKTAGDALVEAAVGSSTYAALPP